MQYIFYTEVKTGGGNVMGVCVCTKRVCVRFTELVCKTVRLLSHDRPAPFPFPLFLFPGYYSLCHYHCVRVLPLVPLIPLVHLILLLPLYLKYSLYLYTPLSLYPVLYTNLCKKKSQETKFLENKPGNKNFGKKYRFFEVPTK